MDRDPNMPEWKICKLGFLREIVQISHFRKGNVAIRIFSLLLEKYMITLNALQNIAAQKRKVPQRERYRSLLRFQTVSSDAGNRQQAQHHPSW